MTSTVEQKDISLWLMPFVALGFASTQLTWALFNNAIPVFLSDIYGLSFGWIGFVMTWDNIIAFFVQPYIGSVSDKTRTQFGRRIPFLVVGMTLGAIFFFLIPFSLDFPIFVLLATIVLFNLSMALYRSPSVSLTPDLLADEKQSVGNGITNFMGGIFAGLSLFVGGMFLEQENKVAAFGFVSAGVIISLIVVLLVVREPRYEPADIMEEEESAFEGIMKEARLMLNAEDKSLFLMLLTLLFWFIAWNAVEAFYSTYVWKVFLPEKSSDYAAGVASQVQSIFPIVFVVFTLVGGYLGKQIGRLRTMKIGLIIFTTAISLAYFVNEDDVFGIAMSWETSFRIIYAIAGAAWGLINVNSIVVVWHHATDNGKGTGLYYAFASAAAILGPTIVGLTLEFSIKLLFPFSIAALIISFILLTKVKTGEVGDRKSIEL